MSCWLWVCSPLIPLSEVSLKSSHGDGSAGWASTLPVQRMMWIWRISLSLAKLWKEESLIWDLFEWLNTLFLKMWSEDIYLLSVHVHLWWGIPFLPVQNLQILRNLTQHIKDKDAALYSYLHFSYLWVGGGGCQILTQFQQPVIIFWTSKDKLQTQNIFRAMLF